MTPHRAFILMIRIFIVFLVYFGSLVLFKKAASCKWPAFDSATDAREGHQQYKMPGNYVNVFCYFVHPRT